MPDTVDTTQAHDPLRTGTPAFLDVGIRLPQPPARRSFARGARDVLAFSVGATCFAAVIASAVASSSDVRWNVTFVVARWLFVAVLLATPVLHQVATRLGVTRQLPWAMRTPATALLLTCESIVFDVLSAQLG